jgi:hypothetical protein
MSAIKTTLSGLLDFCSLWLHRFEAKLSTFFSHERVMLLFLIVVKALYTEVHAIGQKYCNGSDEHIARQRLRKHGPTRNNRKGLCNPFLGNGSVNTHPRRCNDVTSE